MTYSSKSILFLSPKEMKDAITYGRKNTMTYSSKSILFLSPKEWKGAITFGRNDAMTESNVSLYNLFTEWSNEV